MTDTKELTTQQTPDSFIAQAIQQNVDIDKLERLLAMKERWDKEQARKAFFEALTAFQEECPDIRKTKPVYYKKDEPPAYHYAPLSDIDRQIKALLKKHGFTKRWEIVQEGSKITAVTCVLSHREGHHETTSVPVNADTSGGKNPIQAVGSAIQYGQRYSLIAALGITTADQDIDGRMPELDIDLLYQQYIREYNQLIQIDQKYTNWHPDNFKTDKTPKLYLKAIGEIRKKLAELTGKKA